MAGQQVGIPITDSVYASVQKISEVQTSIPFNVKTCSERSHANIIHFIVQDSVSLELYLDEDFCNDFHDFKTIFGQKVEYSLEEYLAYKKYFDKYMRRHKDEIICPNYHSDCGCDEEACYLLHSRLPTADDCIKCVCSLSA